MEARYYMDPYISASALTRGCSEREGNSNCFGPSHKEMSNFGLYGIIAAGSVTVIELITFLTSSPALERMQMTKFVSCLFLFNHAGPFNSEGSSQMDEGGDLYSL